MDTGQSTKRILPAMTIVCSALLALGCSVQPSTNLASNTISHSSLPSGIAGATTQLLHADYRTYTSISAIADNSDLVARGRIGASYSRAVEGPLPMTYFEFTIEDIVKKGSHGERVGDTITIAQTGGLMDGLLWVSQEDPLFRAGDTPLLFLSKTSTGNYVVVGGPGRRFTVSERGRVTGFSAQTVRFSGSIQDLRVTVG